MEMAGDFPCSNKVCVFSGGPSWTTVPTRNAAPASCAVRKSEGIAKICGEASGGCAKLNDASEIYFFISPVKITQNDQLKSLWLKHQ
jgi:hypothetical protein